MAEFEANVEWGTLSYYIYELVAFPILVLLSAPTAGISIVIAWTWSNYIVAWDIFIGTLIGNPIWTILSWMPNDNAPVVEA